MKRTAVVALVVLLAITAAGASIAAKFAPAQGPVLLPSNSVTICHATGNDPYTRESPNVNGVLNGHAKNHPRDIIPPFDYDGGLFPGQNWDAEGQAIWTYGCYLSPVLTPILECVEAGQGDSQVAHFGYANSAGKDVTIEVGPANMFAPGDENRGQPITFKPGTNSDVFTVPFFRLAPMAAGRQVRHGLGGLAALRRLDPDRQGARPGRTTLAASTSC